MTNCFKVEEKNNGQRLDKFLVEQMGQSRSQIQKMIKAGLVTVNAEKPKTHRFLKIGDNVEIEKISAQSPSRERIYAFPTEQKNAADNQQKINWFARVLNFLIKLFVKSDERTPKIIAKTAAYLIVEKPAGLLVHATENSTAPTLADWLAKKFPEIKKIADSESLARADLTFRPGIVHRLDRDVSGVMLIARNQAAFDYFKKQFQTKQVKKEYAALIHGELERDAGAIEFEISRKSGEGQMASHPKGSGKGKPAVTEYEVERRFINYTLVRARPLTGRTNQIRVHFFAINHPIVGDSLYSTRDFKLKTKVKRILLHATKLSFIDSNGVEKTYESAMPEKFFDFISKLTTRK
ncbi:RluA family pseudouridine synthase [Candidatus Falkowbacteria bacterium]|nr:RluA family pseudouridine synthase [Candidatus Falkowbacteria bacterium]